MRTSYLMLGSVIKCKFKLSLMIDINYNICVTNMFSVLNALALRDSSSYERKLKSEKMCRNQSYFLTMKLICRKKSFSVVENCSKYRVRLLNCETGQQIDRRYGCLPLISKDLSVKCERCIMKTFQDWHECHSESNDEVTGLIHIGRTFVQIEVNMLSTRSFFNTER